MVFIDLKSAFKLVDQPILWTSLRIQGVPAKLISALQNINENNTTRVRSDRRGECTPEIKIEQGVLQGCVLAPLLFNLFRVQRVFGVSGFSVL